jgi:glycine reductase
MREALAAMLRLGRRLAGGAALGPAEDEGYLPRGVRRPGLRERPGAERAVEMLTAKLSGGPFRTEITVEPYESVAPALPVADLRAARIALVTTGAIVPLGNPDRLRRSSETRWARYPIDGVDALSAERFECVHGGFYNATACRDPNLVLPVDALRALERDGRIGSLVDFYCTTTGNDQRLGDCARNGREIAAALRAAGVNGACLVAT